MPNGTYATDTSNLQTITFERYGKSSKVSTEILVYVDMSGQPDKSAICLPYVVQNTCQSISVYLSLRSSSFIGQTSEISSLTYNSVYQQFTHYKLVSMITSEIRLDVHILTVRERGKKNLGNYLDLDNFLPNSDILPLFQDFVNSLSKLSISEVSKKSIRFTNKINYRSNDRIVSGICESGDYGIESTITDKRGNRKAIKNNDDLDVKPFYFLLWIPKQANIGILITQRIGIYGVSGLLKSLFKKFFQDRFSDNMAEFSPYMSKETANKFIEDGGIKEIILKRMNLPSDISDRFGLSFNTSDIESIELKITAKKNSVLPIKDKAKEFINNPNSRLFTIDELPKIGFDGNHHSLVKIKLGRRQQTIDLSDVGKVQPLFDVDALIVRHPSGHPVFESIDKVALDLIEDLREEIFGS